MPNSALNGPTRRVGRVNVHPASLDLLKPRGSVDERRLPSTVRADQPDDSRSWNLETYVSDRHEATKLNLELMNYQCPVSGHW
jgi:hypothetical protein